MLNGEAEGVAAVGVASCFNMPSCGRNKAYTIAARHEGPLLVVDSLAVVRNVAIELDDAIEMSEQTEV